MLSEFYAPRDRAMGKQEAPCRLFVYLAREAPVAVVLRRGPSDWARLPWIGNHDFAELRHLIGEGGRGWQRPRTCCGQVVKALYQFCNSPILCFERPSS